MFHLLLLALQTNNAGSPGAMRGWLLDALVPAEKLVDSGTQGVRGVWTGYLWLVGVRDQNHKLEAENNRLRLQILQQEEEIREARRLRSLLGLSESGIGKTLAARVIGRDPTRQSQTLTLDRGKSDGVKVDDSVITPLGVVGRVIGVGRGSAVVQLITDSQSSVAATLRESRVQALFRGNGGQELDLDYVSDDGDIAVGEQWVTSGLDRIHPRGMPLAIVTYVGPKGDLFKIVRARPNVDFSRLEEVLVVTEPARPDKEGTNDTPTSLPSD